MQFGQALFFVALGVCALSLQGCGESSSDGPYASKSQGALNEMIAQGERNSPVLVNAWKDFREKGGCTAFRAVDFKARSARSVEVAEKVVAKMHASSCNLEMKLGGCKQVMGFEAVDIMLFTAEKLTGFLTWKAKNEAWWTEKYSLITNILQTITLPAVGEVWKAFPADATMKNIDEEWLKGELEKVNAQALDVFCPSTVMAAPQTARRLESDLLV